jgi:hypothetical protein
MIPLSNFDIEHKMKGNKLFKGVFMSDVLPSKIEKGSYIINLDKIANSGTHWVCAYHDGGDTVEYFDPFGYISNNDTTRFLKSTGQKVLANTSMLQHPLSKACGYYCMYYIMERDKGKSMYDIIYSFDQSDTLNNEKIIKEFFKL